MLRVHHILLPAIALIVLSIYLICLVKLYAYERMVPIETGLDYWIVFAALMLIVFSVFPARIVRPSDLFLFFYVLISLAWNSVLWNGTALVDYDTLPLYFGILVLPAVVVKTVLPLIAPLARDFLLPVQLASREKLATIFVVLLICGALIAFWAVGVGSFDWDDMYVRRMHGRDVFATNAAAAYATGMATNGVLPMLGFMAGYRRSLTLFATAAGFILLMFFLLGLKAPAINFIALAALGFCFRSHRLWRNFVPLTLAAIFVVYLLALVGVIFDDNTFLADYLVRRISMVQPQVQSFYFDYWIKGGIVGTFPAGVPQTFSDTTFAIGYIYFGNALTNANTNAFIYALGKGGVVDYAISILAVTLIYAAIDAFAEQTESPAFFALGALFGILLAEQAWTTVLVTSGVALCFVLTMLFSYRDSPHQSSNQKQSAL